MTRAFRYYPCPDVHVTGSILESGSGSILVSAEEGSKSLVLGALAAQPASGKDLAEIRSLVDEFENTRKKIITLLNQPWTEV